MVSFKTCHFLFVDLSPAPPPLSLSLNKICQAIIYDLTFNAEHELPNYPPSVLFLVFSCHIYGLRWFFFLRELYFCG